MIDGRTKRSDEEIKSAYAEHGSVWKAAESLGMCGQSVHERLKRMGVPTGRAGLWSEKEIDYLVKNYERYANDARLNDLAESLGREKANVCKKARSLGLTNQSRGKPERMKAEMSESRKRWHEENEHPRGFAGKAHSDKAKIAISEKSREAWEGYTEEQKGEMIWKRAKSRAKNGRVNERKGCSWKAGWRHIGEKEKYYRSRWEANYARYLEFLKSKGEIEHWEHEPETFFFEGIRRGCVSYLPDFKVTNNDGSIEYHEVKGWMDRRSKTKIKRMAKYHPNVTLILIQKKQYEEIRSKLGRALPGWEE